MKPAKHRNRIQHTTLSTALALGLAVAPGAHAVELDYEISAGVIHNSNIILSETEEISETTIAPGIDFTLTHEGRSVDLVGRGNARYLYYTGDTFDNEVRGEFSGHMRWRMLPERLDFVVEDYLSQQPVDILSPVTPSNAQQVNILIGGPSLYLNLSDRTRAQFDARYSRSEAEETSEFDADRVNAAARVLHELGPTTRTSLNVESNRIRFDQAGVASDYDRLDGYVNFQRNLRQLDFSVDLGYSTLDIVDGDSYSSPLGRASLGWRFSPETSINAQASYQFSDTAQSLSSTPVDPDVPIGTDIDVSGVIVSSDPYEQRRLDLGFSHSGPRHGVDASAWYERSEYVEEDDFDNTNSGAAFAYTFRINPLLDLVASVDHQRRDFTVTSRLDKDTNFGVGLAKRFTRHWSARLDLRRRSRDSSVQGFSYDDNAVTVSLVYRR
ncbi:outer membrane beta-barrel protein [Marilutibacter aestuarii]|uniref:Outer membrane beta-barrel protein n=1 Tax=Marilutibacter aestuarii TaxID=1706195 RepID=A0A507ZUW4_9GAMM|nr:outer membrane beta-barrel protein [Lysobacter aestuarii]TQD41470.1 outer membrane beta-barrel protein [Lysobacter aestuarii]